MLESQTDLLNVKTFFMQDQRIKPSSGGKPLWVEGLAIGDCDNDVPIYESDKDDDNEDADADDADHDDWRNAGIVEDCDKDDGVKLPDHQGMYMIFLKPSFSFEPL